MVPLKYLLKIKIAAQDKFSEASVNRFQNRCYLKSRINDRKTPVLESLVNKVADLKRESSTSVFLGILRNSNKQLFLKYTCYPVDTGRKLNVHKTFRTSSERLMYVQFMSCTYWVDLLKDWYNCFLLFLIEKHLNEHIIYYNFVFLIKKNFWNLSSLLHSVTHLFNLFLFICF